MKKIYLTVLFLIGFSLPVAAQRYWYGIYGQMFNIAGSNRYVVTGVDPYGPASRAGIVPTDLILSVDGNSFTNETSLADKKSGVFKINF